MDSSPSSSHDRLQSGYESLPPSECFCLCIPYLVNNLPLILVIPKLRNIILHGCCGNRVYSYVYIHVYGYIHTVESI